MKILYHHRILSKDGQFVHIEEMCDALRRLGHDVVLVGPAVVAVEKLGADAGLISWLKRHLPKFLYETLECAYALPAYLRLRRACRLHSPDCIYERYQLFQPAGVWIRRRYGVKLLLEVNSPLAEERGRVNGLALGWLARWLERVTWRSADVVLPATEALAPYIRAAGVPEARIRVIRNAVRPESFADAPDTETAKQRLGLAGRIVLGFTGFMREWHNMERVVEFIAGQRDARDLHLLLVGDGPSRPAIEALAQRLGVGDRLTVTGVVGRDAVPGYVAAFDVAINIDSVPYALALKLFEYLAMGRAVIAHDRPNIREILTHGHNAILFDPDDPGAFRDAMISLCGDAELRLRLGQAARRTIAEKGLTWDDNARRVETLMQGLVNGE